VKRGLFDEGGDGFGTLFDEGRIRAFQKYVGLGLYGGFGDFYGLFVCGFIHFRFSVEGCLWKFDSTRKKGKADRRAKRSPRMGRGREIEL
jgi:hypothetical protein